MIEPTSVSLGRGPRVHAAVQEAAKEVTKKAVLGRALHLPEDMGSSTNY